VPPRYQRIILDALGLFTVVLALDAALSAMSGVVGKYGKGIPTYGARVGMVAVGSLLIGAIIGTALRLHERLEGIGGIIHRRFGRSDSAPLSPQEPHSGPPLIKGRDSGARFAEAFLTASVIFCVGPLTLLGCLNNGTRGDPSLLYIKAFLDGFCSMALAASLGLGVVFSVLTVLFFQGGLALLAHYAAGGLPDLSIQIMNIVGGVILLATAMLLLEIKKIPAANLLPGIFLPPVAVWLVERAAKGMLITE
jgi:uncharacterized membrane protein YqgA involved in biofilm formation